MLAILTLLAAASATPPTLHELEGRRRVLVVIAPRPHAKSLEAQDRLLARDAAGLAARDVAVVRVVGAAVTGAAEDGATLRRRFDVAPGAFAVRLIGKDGHVALGQAHPIALSALFAAIDAMPMRRDEAARRGR